MAIIFKPHQSREYARPYLPENPVIVEAGAFNGKDTERLYFTWPKSTIYAFEPVPEVFARLESNTIDLPNVHRYQLALSDHNGTATFYVSEKPDKPGIASQAGSLLKPKERLNLSPLKFLRTIEVQTITLPTWAQQNSIAQIDFLWLDMQGHELHVLKASGDLLNKVKVIQVEVGFVEAYEGQQTYKDVRRWLEGRGFEELGRDFAEQESWFFGNALFVRKL